MRMELRGTRVGEGNDVMMWRWDKCDLCDSAMGVLGEKASCFFEIPRRKCLNTVEMGCVRTSDCGGYCSGFNVFAACSCMLTSAPTPHHQSLDASAPVTPRV